MLSNVRNILEQHHPDIRVEGTLSERALLVRRGGTRWVARCCTSAQANDVLLGGRVVHQSVALPTQVLPLDDDQVAVLRPYLEGQALREAVAADPRQLPGWCADILAGLAALHTAGVSHGDIKAENVIVADGRAVLVDLELSAALGTAPPPAGSFAHVAPERLRGAPVTPAGDLFAVGAMIAQLLLGRVAPDFHERFPRESFWAAAGLDPSALPATFAELVSRLVRRAPQARPLDARDALGNLPPDHLRADLGPGLPLLAGRQADFDALLTRATASAAPLLVEVEDEPECRALGALLAGALRLDVDGACDVLVCTEPDEIAAAWVRHVRAGEPPFVAVGTLAGLNGLTQLTGLELPRTRWRCPGVSTVRDHLLELTGNADPGGAEALARSLVSGADGRWSVLARELEGALASGNLRTAGDRLAIARQEWVFGQTHAEPPEDATERTVLQSLGVGRRPCPLGRLPALLPRLDDEARVRAVESLRRDGRLLVDDRGVRATADATPRNKAVRQAAHAAWAEALQGVPGAHGQQQIHRALAEPDNQTALRRALDAVDAERLSGRLGRAVDLLDQLPEDCGSCQPARAALAVRLETNLGHAEQALAELVARHGPELATASVDELAAAWLCARQGGRNEQAATIGQRLAESSEASARAWGLLARAHDELAGGEDEAVLASLADLPPCPAEVAVTADQLRGAALLRLGRSDDARETFERALVTAHENGDVAGEARALLNLGYLERRDGDLERATSLLDEAVQKFTQAQHVAGRALALNNAGTLERDMGRLTSARSKLNQALWLRTRLGDAAGAASSRASLGLVALDAGTWHEARQLLVRAHRELEDLGRLPEDRVASLHLAAAEALTGEAVAARERLARIDASEDANHSRVEAMVALAEGDEAAAQAAARTAVARAQEAQHLGERFRAAAFLHALVKDPASGRDLEQAAAAFPANSIRQAEAAWRLATQPGEQTSEDWLRVFHEHGRTDLAHAAATRLATRESLPPRTRRRYAVQAQELAAALAAGAPDDARTTTDLAVRLAAGPPPGPPAGAHVDWLLRFNRQLAAQRDLETLLDVVVDEGLRLTDAASCLVALLGSGEPSVEVARTRAGHTVAGEHARFSSTVLRRAVEAGEPLVVTDAISDERFATFQSVRSLELRAVLCAPFRLPDGSAGALYIDDAGRSGAFDSVDVRMVSALADQASIAIANVRQREHIERLNVALSERLEDTERALDEADRRLRRRGESAPLAGMVGESEALSHVAWLTRRFAAARMPVLVRGPSGSGKDIVARALHAASDRADGPCLVENVAALPSQLLESEMFGHVRGAFTGADRDRPGLFREADGGTFVLDEIGEMPLELQAKLLRVLESGEYRPVGARETHSADVRVVAVTNRDLLECVREGTFREDLYYRLAAAEIVLPSLAERPDDIPLLARHFVRRLNADYDLDKSLAQSVELALMGRAWPGNVRELSNEIARLYALANNDLDDPGLLRRREPVDSSGSGHAWPASMRLEDIERVAIERALEACQGRKSAAAELLGISRPGLYSKLKRLGLDDRAPDG